MSTTPPSPLRLLVFAPSRRRASETFIRANLRGLPCSTTVYCGDEWPWRGPPLRLAYGLAVGVSKLLDRCGWQRAASWLPSLVATWICRHERPSLVLAEFGFHAVRIMELVPATGLPLVVHFRGADASSQRYLGRLSHRYRRLLALASAVVVKCEPMAARLRQLEPPRPSPLPLLVSPSGANAELFGGGAPAAAAPCFLAVGRFVAKKGPLITLEAFAIAARTRPALQLVMVGEGPLLEPARRRAVELGVAERVQFAGVEPPPQIAVRLRHCRGFVQHSLTGPDGDQEGSPVAVMEAQLSGVPVVATRHAGIPEVVLDGHSGLLVEEGDGVAMAEAIGRLADDPALAARLGAAGRARALEQFTVTHHLRALMDLFQRVAAMPMNSSDTLPR
ncbi:MAG: glycosyltransferase [Cyanobacteria bacterium M_surface_10_m2_179]|nr:glycosyltransferase [Cyanobacteria bacterium M_surface_10_m2_179]